MPRMADHLSEWRMWLKDMVIVLNNVSYHIKTFRLFQGPDFPSKAVMLDFANKWKPIFGMMELYDGFLVPDVVDDEFVHSSFDVSVEYLKTWALYCMFGGRLKIRGSRMTTVLVLGVGMFRGVQLRSGVLIQTRHCFQLQLHVIRHTELRGLCYSWGCSGGWED